MIGHTLERLCACQSTERTWQGWTRDRGDKGSFVLHWFFYNEFEDAQEQAPAQVPNHDKFVDAQTTLCPSLTLRRTYVHLDSCSLTVAHTLLPGDHCSLISLSGCQPDGTLQNCNCKVALNCSPMRTYCVLGYLLLEQH